MPTDLLVLIPLAALLLALAALFLPPAWRTRGALLGAGIATIATTTVLVQNDQQVPELEVADRPITDPHTGYVGSAACRSCHAHEHDTWDSSYHQSMTQVASPETVLGDFDNFEIDVKGKHYKLTHDGKDYWVELEDEVAQGPEKPRVKRRIVLTTGSHNMQVYWFESGYAVAGHGRVMGQMPLSWQVEEQRWITRDASFVLPPEDSHSLQYAGWNLVCIKCHATQGRPKLDIAQGQVADADTRVTEFGIACESCHGPGAEHVAVNKNPLRRYSQRLSNQPDPTIVNPKNLDPKQSTQVCGQCHAVWDYGMDDQRMRIWSERGFDYRPGGDVEKIRKPQFSNKVGESGFWPDGLIRTAGREYNALLGSPCYEKGGMSCLSCHEMHPADTAERTRKEWASDQLHLGGDNRSCMECHESFALDIPAHTHHALGSSGSSCVNCHMPHTTYGLMKGTRTHRIESPSVKVTMGTGRPNACNMCHLDQTLGWTAKHLDQWYGIKAPTINRADERASAIVRGILEGDAGMRALMAWTLGWPEAQAASGTDWMEPYLAELLVDPYPAVRIIAERSLRTLPGYETFRKELDAAPELRQQAKAEVLTNWSARGSRTGTGSGAAAKPARPQILMNADGTLDVKEYARLLKRRNLTKIRLVE